VKHDPNRTEQGRRTVFAETVRGSRQSGVRAYNERLVLTLIRQMGPLAKARIARLTDLSAQTVSVIMRELEADGLLEKGQPVRGKVGQPSVPMNLARDGAYFLGLKVGRRSLDLVLTDFLGHVESRVRRTHRYPVPEQVVRFANDAIGRLLDRLGPEKRSRVAGLGIAIPFHLWYWARSLGVRPADMAVWQDSNIASEIGKDLDFPVYMQNDASAACGAELVFGKQDKPSEFLYFFIGYFVGGGMVLNDSLYTGRTGNAAALGPMPAETSNGKIRQLMDIASLATLEKTLIAQGGDGESIWSNPSSWTIDDRLLDDWITSTSAGLAVAIISSTCLIDFGCVMIDGWIPVDVRAEIVRRSRLRLGEIDIVGIDLPEIREGTVGCDARSLGAASLPLSERFLLDRGAVVKE